MFRRVLAVVGSFLLGVGIGTLIYHLPPPSEWDWLLVVIGVSAFFSILIFGALAWYILGRFRGGDTWEVLEPDDIDVDFDSIVGMDAVLDEVKAVLELYRLYRDVEAAGGRAPRGVLFDGGPGTGKTHTASAIAREAGVPFINVDGSRFLNKFVGESARLVRSIFKEARKVAAEYGGCVVYIDEIDAAARKRSSEASDGGARVGDSIVNAFLVEMDGAASHVKDGAPPILVIASTNRPDALDPALLRPGRFDRKIHFPAPTRSGRRAIAEFYLRKANADPELADVIAAALPGATGAEIAGTIHYAIGKAVRAGDHLTREHIQDAILITQVGIANPADLDEDQRQRIAVHEAGHAVMLWAFAPDRRPDVLTIRRRSHALGLLAHTPHTEEHVRTASQFEGLARVALGGLVAEQLAYDGNHSSGVSGDLQSATQLVATAVGSCGMGDHLAAHPAPSVEAILKDRQWRAEVDTILDRLYDEVEAEMRRLWDVVTYLADTLLEAEELYGEEIIATIEEGAREAKVDRVAA